MWPWSHLPIYHFPIVLHLPVGHLPPVSATSCELYDLFPMVIRLQSLFASGLLDESDTQESILKKICSALEAECGLTTDEIERLTQLVDPDRCPSAALPILANMVGARLGDGWSAEKKRMVIKATVLVWMIKGTKMSWEVLLRLESLDNYLPWELWKSIPYELFNYSTGLDYYHQLRAARIDFTLPTDPSTRLTETEAAERMAIIDPVRPIHVLLRPFPDVLSISDTLALPTETVSITPKEVSSEVPPDLVDDITVVLTCVSWCESSCQSACEYGCQTSCEALCETTCQTGCELSCELSCTSSCEVTNETGA